MANIGKYDQSKYLKAEDLEKGKFYTRIIDRVTEEEVGQGNDKATIPVAWFRGDYDKGLGLSAKINRNMLAHNFNSDETDDWHGRKFTFYRTMTEYAGKAVPCIRIRPTEDDALAEEKAANREPGEDDDPGIEDDIDF